MKALFRYLKHLLAFAGLLARHLYIETRQYIRICYYQHKDSRSPEVVMANLTVSAHALDKSLCITHREPTRGRSEYQACKQMIAVLEKTSLSNDPSLQWARETVEKYERSLSNSAYSAATSSPNVCEQKERDAFLTLIRTRRSVRHFKHGKIDASILSELVDIARWAPNSCCRQSVFFYVTEKQEEIAKCMNLTLGATCFSETIPYFICVCGDTRFYPLVDKGLLYIDGAFATENLLLAAHAYGIEGTVLNWRQHMYGDEERLKQVLGITSHHSVVVNIAIGYPESVPSPPMRKDLRSVWKFNKE